jgi:hypothetical protein
MNSQTVDTARSIRLIDSIVDVALRWMEGNDTFIRIEFMKVFAKAGPELISQDTIISLFLSVRAIPVMK